MEDQVQIDPPAEPVVEQEPLNPADQSNKAKLIAAQERIAKAIGASNADPRGTIFAAYVNGMLQTARTSAIIEAMCNPPNNTWKNMAEYIDVLTLRHMATIARAIEAQNAATSRILTANPGSVHDAVRKAINGGGPH